jgi:hypothetical protein
MVHIFVSHSQYDKDIRTAFDTVFARTGVESKCMEFEKIYPPAWETIKNQIFSSEAVFLLLGPNIRTSAHTQNWIAFEVGLACASGKDVWVFEDLGSSIDFPIPYLTDYSLYNFGDKPSFDYTRTIISGYGKPIPMFPLAQDNRTKREIPRGILVECKYQNCNSKYFLHTIVGSFNCPSCRQPLTNIQTT